MNQQVEIPAAADRARILDVKQMAALCGLSVPHLRRLYRTGKVPAGIRVGERKLGWPLGVATDFWLRKVRTLLETREPEFLRGTPARKR